MTDVHPPLDVRPATGLLKALADDTRLRILALLSHGELCVCHLATALEISQPNASQHLTVLRHAGVVESRRRGSWSYYRMAVAPDPVRARILAAVLAGLTELEGGREDLRRLAESRDGVSCS